MGEEDDDSLIHHQRPQSADGVESQSQTHAQTQSLPQQEPTKSPTSKPKRRTRTRTGCLNCRRKKRKCDELRPSCGACQRRDQTCEWGLKVSFRAENAQHIDESHPSMKRMAKKRFTADFEILDVTSDVIRDYLANPPMGIESIPSPTIGPGSAAATATTEPGGAGPTPPSGSSIKNKPWRNHGASNYGDKYASPTSSTTGTVQSNPGQRDNSSLQSPVITSGASPLSNRHADSAVASLLYLSQGKTPINTMAVDNVDINMSGTGYVDVEGFPSEGIFEDGVFLPGTAYHEWHSTLRNHLIQEVKSSAPTRAATPHFDLEPDADVSGSGIPRSAHHFDDALSDTELAFVSKMEECTLWRTWFDEIAPWLDKFDNKRHFQHIIPTMAADHAHLRLSILAVSARQIELKATNMPNDRSLALYQEAIHLLLPHLPQRSTPVIASCLILCVLEMLSCSPKAWQRHLDGCASLMEAVGINGFVGGVEQALFWCFARMDVCGGLISSVKTLIPVTNWASKREIEDDVKLFESIQDFTGWANYSVYLMGQVVDLLMPTSAQKNAATTTTKAHPDFRARWIQLWKYICDWHDRRPAALLPVMTIASSAASPFPTIIFSNPAAISGNQLHHTASLLMLQNQPPGHQPVPKPRSILWHARRVCAISISNNHHGAWTNAIQPLWIAGRCMSNPTEHKAILQLLERIETESGWGTSWRADDLRAFWGDLSE